MKAIDKKNLPYLILLVVIVGLAIFFGIKYLKPKNAQVAGASDQTGQNSRFGGRGGFNRGNFTPPITGTISSINGQVIVMQASDGSTKNVTCDSSTRISEMQNGSRTTLQLSDLKTGETINVMSNDTAGANITAQMIFIGTMDFPNRNHLDNSNDLNTTPGNI